jgi:hypothetical protein
MAVEPGSFAGVGLFENVVEEAMEAASSDVVTVEAAGGGLKAKGYLVHVLTPGLRHRPWPQVPTYSRAGSVGSTAMDSGLVPASCCSIDAVLPCRTMRRALRVVTARLVI